MNASQLITGHNLIQPAASVAPLEFDFTPGDAELLATCAAAVEAIRAKNAAVSLEDELEAQGFMFVEPKP